MTVSYPSVLSLYNHLRFVGVSDMQKSKWVNTDLELVLKPGLIKRLFSSSDTDTKITSVLETLTAEVSNAKNKSIKAYGNFVLGVLTIRSEKKDHNFGILSRLNVARYLLSHAFTDDSNFAPLQAQYEGLERRYMLGETVKQADLQKLISAIKALPMQCWGNLLPDVLMIVCEYLPVVDLANAAKVNNHWKQTAQAAWHIAKRMPNVHLLSLARNYQTLPLQYVAENQRAIQVFKDKSLVSREICALSMSGTLFEDVPHKFTSDTNTCAVTDINDLIVIKTDPATKIQTKIELDKFYGKPLVHRGELYMTYLNYPHVPGARPLYLAHVDVATGKREVLYQNVLQHPQFVSLYKSKAYFALTNHHIVTVDLETRVASQTSTPFQGHIYKYLAYDRYIYSDQQSDLKVKNLSDPGAVDITLPETIGATVLSATPSLVVVNLPDALQVAVFSLETGVRVFTYDSDLLGAIRATVHRGMLFVEQGDFDLRVVDLSSKTIVQKIKFEVPTLCHPYLDKIFYATYPDQGFGPEALREMG